MDFRLFTLALGLAFCDLASFPVVMGSGSDRSGVQLVVVGDGHLSCGSDSNNASLICACLKELSACAIIEGSPCIKYTKGDFLACMKKKACASSVELVDFEDYPKCEVIYHPDGKSMTIHPGRDSVVSEYLHDPRISQAKYVALMKAFDDFKLSLPMFFMDKLNKFVDENRDVVSDELHSTACLNLLYLLWLTAKSKIGATRSFGDTMLLIKEGKLPHLHAMSKLLIFFVGFDAALKLDSAIAAGQRRIFVAIGAAHLENFDVFGCYVKSRFGNLSLSGKMPVYIGSSCVIEQLLESEIEAEIVKFKSSCGSQS